MIFKKLKEEPSVIELGASISYKDEMLEITIVKRSKLASMVVLFHHSI